MSKNTTFKLNVTYLQDNISSFCNDIINMEDVLCHVTEVETLDKSHEENSPEQISVYCLNDGPLKSKSLLDKIYGSFYVKGQSSASTKITKKFPGVIILPSHTYEFISAKVTYINKLKKECADSFRKLANNHEDRFTIAHEIFPRLISFQVFRDLQLITTEGSINRINFYWRETMITKKYNKKQLLEYLYNKRTFVIDKSKLFNKNLDVWQDIDLFIDKVNLLPNNSQFRIKRHSFIPTPAANIYVESNDKIININKRSSIPFILFKHPKEITLLTNFDINKSKQSNRVAKSKYISLLPSINLELAVNSD